ncbi:hypothetical protein F5Y19DRAFT_471199 [Xylariaceae sp. FL1651]|nr:hypothetical protein F5Y19DRAFT_471199 [Xylariaceae sp. FL1651]
MANSLAALKSLPCPAGDKCTAFQCLFSHTRDRSENDSSDSSKNNSNKITTKASFASSLTVSHARPDPCEEIEDSPEPGRPRKRIKVGLNSTSASLQHSSALASSVKPKPSEQRKIAAPDTPKAVQESNSLHTLGRKPPPSAEVNSQTVGHQANAQHPIDAVPPAPNSTPGPKPATKQKQKSKEPESLNPRLLKKAPASHSTRVALVKALHKEYERLNNELKKVAQGIEKKLLLSNQELIVKSLDDEQEIAVKKTSIYNTSIRSRILMYKKMSLSQWKEERARETQKAGPDSTEPASATSAAQPIDTGLTLSQEIEFLPRLVWDLASLQIHGYISKIPSAADIESALAGVAASGNTETCDRCTRRFLVFPGRREEDGALASNGSCKYHPGRLYVAEKTPGDRSRTQRKYRCCHQNHDDEEGGCTTAPTHVFKTVDPKRLAAVLNFVNTPTNPDVPKDRAVCFDCEMGYTVYGLELIRMTVVSWPKGEMLLDILVQPAGEILDLNTRYSGVRAEDMAKADRCEVGGDHRPTVIPSADPTKPPQRRLKIAPSPKMARDLLFTLISAETPLIGHGLENDMNAARFIHPTCIDTVLLWPHPRGLPSRYGLKYLMETKLNRKIQLDPAEGIPEGHDSAEDARAAGDLARLKIREEWKDMRMKGWTVTESGKLVAPGNEWTVVGGAKVKKSGYS